MFVDMDKIPVPGTAPIGTQGDQTIGIGHDTISR
jgi:hypothetical protein